MIDHDSIMPDGFQDPQDLYRQNILDHNRNPRNRKTVDGATFRHRDHNFSCGDELEISLRLDDAGKVEEIGFEGSGCAISQASVSMLTELVLGMTLGEIEGLGEKDIAEMLGIEIGPARRNCALLGLTTLRKAVSKK
jgi:nitrogen fixation NifU-like protein